MPESLLHHLAWLDFPSENYHLLVISGGYNKMPQIKGLKEQILISHNSGGWKFKMEVPADLVSDESALPGLQMSSPCYVLTCWRAERK